MIFLVIFDMKGQIVSYLVIAWTKRVSSDLNSFPGLRVNISKAMAAPISMNEHIIARHMFTALIIFNLFEAFRSRAGSGGLRGGNKHSPGCPEYSTRYNDTFTTYHYLRRLTWSNWRFITHLQYGMPFIFFSLLHYWSFNIDSPDMTLQKENIVS